MIKPQVNDVWQGKTNGLRREILHVAEKGDYPIMMITDSGSTQLRSYKNLEEEYILIERDGNPYKKEKTGEELVNHICYVGGSTVIRLIVAYTPKSPYPYRSHPEEYWDVAREVPKEDLLKLGNFKEGE